MTERKRKTKPTSLNLHYHFTDFAKSSSGDLQTIPRNSKYFDDSVCDFLEEDSPVCRCTFFFVLNLSDVSIFTTARTVASDHSWIIKNSDASLHWFHRCPMTPRPKRALTGFAETERHWQSFHVKPDCRLQSPRGLDNRQCSWGKFDLPRSIFPPRVGRSPEPLQWSMYRSQRNPARFPDCFLIVAFPREVKI